MKYYKLIILLIALTFILPISSASARETHSGAVSARLFSHNKYLSIMRGKLAIEANARLNEPSKIIISQCYKDSNQIVSCKVVEIGERFEINATTEFISYPFHYRAYAEQNKNNIVHVVFWNPVQQFVYGYERIKNS